MPGKREVPRGGGATETRPRADGCRRIERVELKHGVPWCMVSLFAFVGIWLLWAYFPSDALGWLFLTPGGIVLLLGIFIAVVVLTVGSGWKVVNTVEYACGKAGKTEQEK